MSAHATTSPAWISAASDWLGAAWKWASAHLEGLEALGAITAAVLALAALVFESRRRRLDQLLRLTAVSAWAEPVGLKATVEEGVLLSVPNHTGQALQQAQVYIWPRDTKAPAVPPGGTRWLISTISVPLIPPHETRTYPIRGDHFRAWGDQMHHSYFLVNVAFQDARGRWWWRLANGRMIRHHPKKVFQEPTPWDRSTALKPSWPTRWSVYRRLAVAKLKRLLKRER
jgi:hypothetical protein